MADWNMKAREECEYCHGTGTDAEDGRQNTHQCRLDNSGEHQRTAKKMAEAAQMQHAIDIRVVKRVAKIFEPNEDAYYGLVTALNDLNNGGENTQ